MAPTQALKVAMFTPVAPPIPGQAIIVTNASPIATDFESVSGGAFLPNATAPGQTLVSGVGPSFGWTAAAPSTIAVSTFNARNGDVVLNSPDVTTALGFTPYSNANPAKYQTDTQVTASINAALPAPATSNPLMDGTAAAGSATPYARADHVHPTDATRYAAANPAGYQTAAQVAAAIPPIPGASSATPIMDGTAAAGAGTTWARGDHVHPSDTSRYAASNPAGYQTAAQVSALLPPASNLNPLIDGTASSGVASPYAREDHVHPTDTTRYAAANPAGYQTAAQVAAAIAASGGSASPSNSFPIMDGAAAAGSSTNYSRGDHVHPTDSSRAPLASPTFTGAVTLAQDPSSSLQAATKQYADSLVTNLNIDCGSY